MELSTQNFTFSTEISTKGFDNSAGDRWIYPQNFPKRDYQFNIVKSALYHNTLVCLPTGLGKTFIAAVVMYNFWRWYPKGKIIFLAPTKPLVAQQIKACHEIMGIAGEEIIELTGATDQKKRQVAWSESSRARVVFATPQVFQKDLEKDIIPAELIKCVVVDEAHRALGKHSYSESIRLLSEKSKYFRILGLSATPGSKLDAVQEVVRNLYISNLELRDDTSPDLAAYINERRLEIITVGLGADLEKFKDRYITIMDRHVRVLINNNILRGNTSNMSKGKIFLIAKEWNQKPNRGSNHGQMMKTLTILTTMYHAYDLMIRHGLRAFHNFYQKHEDKFWLSDEPVLMQLLEEIKYFLGPFPDIRSMPDENFPDIMENIRFGHKKFYKLKDLLLRHFETYENKQQDTRAIVFVEYRDIVNEVYVLLLQSMPLLRPQKFVGQAGQKRKEQKKALEDFRNNKVNVLISTSVGEEGLDVGEVDLIVCFDISNVSPIRLVQRMGRTGRKRDGHIIILVTDGKEHQTLKASMSRRDSLNSKVMHSSGIINSLYKESPRMVPKEFEPECRITNVVVPSKIPETTTRKTKETKKPRKRAETSNKNKNSKNPVQSGSQSLMKYLKKIRDNNEVDGDDIDDIIAITKDNIFPSTSQTIQQFHCNGNIVKSSNVKLLSCDDAGVEFLTLCVMKRSQNERKNVDVDEEKRKSYFPSFYEIPQKFDFHFKVPDIKILDCLKNLTHYVEKDAKNIENENSMFYENTDDFWTTQRFNDTPDNDNNIQDNVNRPSYSRFEDLLDCSSDDSVKTPTERENDDYPIEEKVDWAENVSEFDFDESMEEWSNATTKKNGKNETIVNNVSDDRNNTKLSKADSIENSAVKLKIFKDSLNDSSRMNETNHKFDVANKYEKGTFEDVLNEDSETSSEFENDEVIKNRVDDSDRFTDLPNDEEWDTSLDKYKSDTTISGLIKTGAFEDLLNEQSTTNSTNNDSNEKNDIDTENQNSCENFGKTINSCEKFHSLKNLLNNVSNDSDTQFNTEYINKKQSDESLFLKSQIPTVDNEIFDEFEANDVKIEKSVFNNDSIDTLVVSNEKISSKPIDSFADKLSKISQISEAEKRNFKITTEKKTNVRDFFITNSTPKKPVEKSSSTISIMETLDSVKRPSGKSVFDSDTVDTVVVSNERVSSSKSIDSFVDELSKISQISDTEKRNFKITTENKTNVMNFFVTKSLKKPMQMSDYVKRTSGKSVFDDTIDTVVISNDRISSSKSIDLFADKLSKISQISDTEKKNVKSTTEKKTNVVDFFITNSTPKKPVEKSSSTISLTGTFDDKRPSTEKNIARNEFKNNEGQDHMTLNSIDTGGCSNTSSRETLQPKKGTVDEIIESDDDIFRNDDLTVDSDFEEEIIKIENSAKDVSSTSIKFEIDKSIDDNNCEKIENCCNSQVTKERKNDDEFAIEKSSEIFADKKNAKDRNSSSSKSFRLELNLNNWKNECTNENSSNIVGDNSKKKDEKDSKSFRLKINRDNDDWNSEVFRIRRTNSEKSFLSEKKTFETNSQIVDKKNSSKIDLIETDLNLDDCDWDSNDFENFVVSSNASTSKDKKVNNQLSTKTLSNQRETLTKDNERFGKIEKMNGWLTTEKPKSRMSLSKKLSRNICNSLSSKLISKKRPPGPESDSENDFIVSRLETTTSNNFVSDYFAKPNPVSSIKKRKELSTISNTLNSTTNRVTWVHDRINKIEDLNKFSAPDKYKERGNVEETNNDRRVVGFGRRKAVSCDFDTRKRRKIMRPKKINKRARVRNEFIDDEAQESSDCAESSESSGNDDDLDGFVSYTQNFDDHVDMQAHYLQTLKSPRRPGGFYIRKPKSPSPDLQIYSQPVLDEPNNYVNDSFCVDENEDILDDSVTSDEITRLEKLEKRRRKRKRKRKDTMDSGVKRRRKVVSLTSDTSSEDEMEKIRRQIHEESFQLKKYP